MSRTRPATKPACRYLIFEVLPDNRYQLACSKPWYGVCVNLSCELAGGEP